VLLGDPQQLPHVAKGTHPLGTDLSILEHVLGVANTIPADRGIFLDRSYRMQPEIDAFVSHAFYDDRLEADDLNAANRVTTAGAAHAGPRYIAVEHAGNTRKSIEEAQVIVDRITALLATGSVVIRDRVSRPLTPADILVVTPYNVARALISDELAKHGLAAVRVGTVDKFQGQEAAIVFYAMTTSNAELAPRGLEFLLSPNRFNVAVSRAQALCIVVCSPELLISCATTIEQMRLLNVLCAYVEAATASETPSLLAPIAN
jgi:superfamily I DNA and/or RNA helicase